ncbi:MAG: 2-C-methyl-D-erythritol 4-phosphate cytidylyltransferase [Thermodesulfobacteriota bacterium]|nr:2-C-methyl-D-erythritol 4-phosphate cytidylyltransferase [Thermodesulfobacteriota bacterium]
MNSAIIVAAGQGTRFGGNLAKQYQPLAGKPLLCHTLNAVCACKTIDAVVLVVADAERDYCRTHVLPHVTAVCDIHMASGGAERQASVLNGLAAVGGGVDDGVLIHDGVRPFVTPDLIDACLTGLADADGCMAAIPASDTLAAVTPDHVADRIVDRNGVWQVQTPQAFRYGVILEAHRTAVARGWRVTDDASLLLRLGKKVRVVTGSSGNIKITTPDDMALAQALAGAL